MTRNHSKITDDDHPLVNTALVDALAEAVAKRMHHGNIVSAPPVDSIDFFDFFIYCLKRVWFVLVMAIAFGGLMGIYFSAISPSYTATARVFGSNLSHGHLDYGQIQASTALMTDYREIFQLPEIHLAVQQQLAQYDNRVEKAISVYSPKDSHILCIDATWDDPRAAADIANAYANAGLQFVEEVMQIRALNQLSPATPPVSPSTIRRNAVVKRASLAGCAVSMIGLTGRYVCRCKKQAMQARKRRHRSPSRRVPKA